MVLVWVQVSRRSGREEPLQHLEVFPQTLSHTFGLALRRRQGNALGQEMPFPVSLLVNVKVINEIPLKAKRVLGLRPLLLSNVPITAFLLF